MRKVIDTNLLRDSSLQSYLSASAQHFAVLTDYSAMEGLKGDPLIGLFKQMEILSHFPSQAIVLKDTKTICGLRGRMAGLQRRLIDTTQSAEFSTYIEDLRKAAHGDARLRNKILQLAQKADEQFSRILRGSEQDAAAFDELSRMYSDQERGLVRDGKYSPAIIDRILKGVTQQAANLLRNHPNVRYWPNAKEAPNTLIFRVTLCRHLLTLERIARGSMRDMSAKKVVNDMVDMTFSAYGTFFDGVLSADKMVLRVHRLARQFLSIIS